MWPLEKTVKMELLSDPGFLTLGIDTQEKGKYTFT